MTLLDEIIATVAAGNSTTVTWRSLADYYFQSENAIEQVSEWADHHGMIARFGFRTESPLKRTLYDVTFVPKT